MFRAASLLKDTRLDKEWELSDISKKLKIPLKYLQAIEDEDISNFPQEPYCSLIIKDYADHLGLNGSDIVSLFRRDFDQKKKNNPKMSSFLSFTPQLTFKIFIILSFFIFCFYLGSEYIKFHQPPKLKVNWPVSSSSTSSNIEISGITDPEATIRVNGDLILVDPNGNFSKKINLLSGDNKIIIQSTSSNGKITTEEETINYSL